MIDFCNLSFFKQIQLNFVEKYFGKTDISDKIFAFSVEKFQKINKRGATLIRFRRVGFKFPRVERSYT